MPPTPPAAGPLRSAEELNAAIRALWLDGRGHPTLRLTDEQRAEYERLCLAVREAERIERGDVVEAA